MSGLIEDRWFVAIGAAIAIVVFLGLLVNGCSVASVPSVTREDLGGKTCVNLDPYTAKQGKVPAGVYCLVGQP